MGGVGEVGGGVGLGGQSGCELRIEVFVKIQKKKIWGGVGGRGRVGGGGGGVRVDVNEIEVFVKIQKKNFGGGSGGGGGRVGGGGSVSGWGVRVD